MPEPSDSSVSRRLFLGSTAAATLTSGVYAAPAVDEAQEVVVGVMGLSRGMSLATTFAASPNVRVKYLCDIDTNRIQAAAKSFNAKVDYEVKTTADFRQILDDSEIDALVCAAPNHWHAPASIMACQAGKHAYVEKPCCHNPWEGEMLIKAARRNNRCVQMGNQRRSASKLIEAVRMMHEGRIGRVYYSRSWYANLRGPIGTGKVVDRPAHIDYDMWQGPAPRLPFTSNRLHYDWHWVWHYGNGELGNNGIHTIDLSRWGLQADYPIRVTSSGGRYHYDDDQETPDTHVVSFEFEGERQIVWEALSCNRLGMDGSSFGVTFHGEEGSMKFDGWGYTVYDKKAKAQETVAGERSDAVHIANFANAIRANDPTMLNSEIEEGHKSTLLCHLGNIAQRTGDALTCDPKDGHILDNADAMKLWKREYEPGWEPTV